jgi:hypothetical protein
VSKIYTELKIALLDSKHGYPLVALEYWGESLKPFYSTFNRDFLEHDIGHLAWLEILQLDIDTFSPQAEIITNCLDMTFNLDNQSLLLAILQDIFGVDSRLIGFLDQLYQNIELLIEVLRDEIQLQYDNICQCGAKTRIVLDNLRNEYWIDKKQFADFNIVDLIHSKPNILAIYNPIQTQLDLIANLDLT